MKTCSVVAFLFAAVIHASEPEVSANAPPAAPFTTSLLADPFQYNSQGVTIELQRRVSSRISWVLDLTGQAEFQFPVESKDAANKSKYLRAEVASGVHYYLTGDAPSGLWIGPKGRVGYQWGQGSFRSTAADGSQMNQGFSSRSLSLGAFGEIGYTYVLHPGLTLQLSAGADVQATRSNSELGAVFAFNSPPNGWVLHTGLVESFAVGWSF